MRRSSNPRPRSSRSSALLASVGFLALALAGCAGSLPETGRLPAEKDAFKATKERFNLDGGEVAVKRIRTAGSGLSEVRLHEPVSKAMLRRPIKVGFNTSDATLDDLFQALSANDVQIAFNWSKDGQTSGGGASGGGASGGGRPSGGSSSPSITASLPQSSQTASAQAKVTPISTASSSPSSSRPRSGGGAGAASTAGTPDAILKRRVPFMRYDGTIGGLLDTLRAGTGLVAYQEGNTIFLSDYEQYAITLPQNEDVMSAISDTISQLGGVDLVSSVDAGRVMYSARQDVHDRIIGPFLRRAARNLATIKIQVAVVTLSLNDKSGQGFDWSQFAAVLDQRQAALANAQNSLSATNSSAAASTAGATTGTTTLGSTGTTGSALGTTGTSGPSAILPTTNLNQKGGLVDLTSGSLVLGTTNVGKIFGVSSAASVSGAIQFLSTFGNTNVTQHVDVSALSGKEVKFSSGETIPYVKSVGVGAVGNSNSNSGSSNDVGTAQTDTVKTGIDVSMIPRFESENELVTVDFKMKLASLIEFIQLNAGNQLGTLSQPHTADQELDDIIRVRAGQTIVLGGLQFDNEAFNGNDLTAMRDAERESQTSSGLRAQTVSRSALFVILRPTVLLYEPEEGR